MRQGLDDETFTMSRNLSLRRIPATLSSIVVDAVGNSERGERDAPITVSMTVDGQLVNMEVDTGASKTIMSEKAFRKLWPGRSLDKTDVRLQSYLGEPIPVVGSVIVNEKQRASLPLIVVKSCWVEVGWERSDSIGARSITYRGLSYMCC